MKTMIVWSVTAALATTLTAADFPLRLSHLVTGPGARVEMTNGADQPVTAWGLAVTTLDNARTRREVEVVDGYLSEVTRGLPGSSERLERLMPGQSRQIQLDSLPADATVQVIAVVLDDGTAIGDEEVLTSIFARRARERDALRGVADAFSEVLASKRGGDALAALRERLTALADRDESLPWRAALDSVNTYRRQLTASNGNEIDQSLGVYAAFVRRQHELADRHSRRRAR
jgi:hypothetical protein